jgi:hypothetical protein
MKIKCSNDDCNNETEDFNMNAYDECPKCDLKRFPEKPEAEVIIKEKIVYKKTYLPSNDFVGFASGLAIGIAMD